MRDMANMNVPGSSMAGTETAPDLPSQAEIAAANPTGYPSTMGGVPLGGQPTPAAGPTGFGAAIANPTGPVTPAGVTPAAIVDAPLTGRIDLATAPKADFPMANGIPAPTSDVRDRVAAAWAAKLGADNVRLTGTSGYRTKGGAGRHPAGKAVDYGVEVKNADGSWRSLDFSKQADLDLAREVDLIGVRDFGLKGFGVGQGYMGDKHIHHDVTIPGKGQSYDWTSPAKSSKTVPQSQITSRAAAREAYRAAGNVPAPQQPVASITASPAEMTPQMAALNTLDQTTATASTNAVPTARPDMAGNAPPTGYEPGAGGYPTTPSVPTPTPAPRGTEAAAGTTVTTAAPGTAGFAPTPSAQPQATGFPSFATPATGYVRSGLGTVLGLAIDAGLSVAGGPVSLAANAGSLLLTGDSVGGLITDMVGGKYGPNQYQPGKDDKYSGDRAGGAGSGKQNTTGANAVPSTISKTPTVKPGETTTDEAKLPYEEAFVAKYLDRPTPAEKWGKLGKVSNYVTT
jgi:hypothetical protein